MAGYSLTLRFLRLRESWFTERPNGPRNSEVAMSRFSFRSVSRSLTTAVAGMALVVSQAHAQAGVPQGSSPISNALDWIQGTLMGKVATTVAVIAVAAVGFMMLTGRMNWKFGATVIIGCFILFGAATIVGGIQAVAH